MIKEFQVERNHWLNGNTYNIINYDNQGYDPKLSNNLAYYNMCCLGFFCKAIGLTDQQIDNKNSPESILNSTLDASYNPFGDLVSFDTESEWWKDGELFQAAMVINDDYHMSLGDRERDLIALFLEYGIVLTFVGDYIS